MTKSPTYFQESGCPNCGYQGLPMKFGILVGFPPRNAVKCQCGWTFAIESGEVVENVVKV